VAASCFECGWGGGRGGYAYVKCGRLTLCVCCLFSQESDPKPKT
jgi:hypothetical protein